MHSVPPPAPVRPGTRLLGVDVLRALAVLGMVWAHFVLTGWLSPAAPGTPPDATLLWINGLLGTRSREVFFLLAGVSLALMTGGHRPRTGPDRRTDTRRVLVRSGLLLLCGLALGSFGFGDVQILHFYALWLLLLLPLARLRVPVLLGLAGVLAVAAPVFKVAAERAGGWGFVPDPMDPVFLELHHGFALLAHPADWWPTAQNVLFGLGGGSQDTVSVLPFLVLGLALGRLDLRSGATRLRLLAAGTATAVTAVLAGLLAMYPLGAVAAVRAYREPPLPALPSDVPPPPPLVPWQQLVTLGHPGPAEKVLSVTEGVMMLGLIAALLGGLLILLDRQPWRVLLRPLAAFGGMALTWYVGHFLVLKALPVATAGPGLPGGRSALAFLVFTVLALAASVLWRRRLRRGPLEWLMHTVTTRAVPRRDPARHAVSGSGRGSVSV
ncbi:DUF418 domain-containing protein [Streptomyces sp. NPDC048659]|uniref:DUF418 domain-containing protein n=1 Tax=Streptomyces sp. NPDC048659 TaxID=3155489 RepID=UPI0034476CF9